MMQEISKMQGTNLYNKIIQLRAEVVKNKTDLVTTLINSDVNRNGEFYKYFFDGNEVQYGNPDGNSILMLAISKGCDYTKFNDPQSTKESVLSDAKIMVDAILNDAKIKLTPEELKDFVSLPFQGNPDEDYYCNTPLTLAIKVGLIDEAIKIIEYGADVNDTGNNYGGHTPLHLTIMRLLLEPSDDNNMNLLITLSSAHASKDINDKFNMTPIDLVRGSNYENFYIGNIKQYKVSALYDFSKELGLKKGELYSLKDLINNAQFVNYYNKLQSNNDLQLNNDLSSPYNRYKNIKNLHNLFNQNVLKFDNKNIFNSVAYFTTTSLPSTLDQDTQKLLHEMEVMSRHYSYDYNLSKKINCIFGYESNMLPAPIQEVKSIIEIVGDVLNNID